MEQTNFEQHDAGNEGQSAAQLAAKGAVDKMHSEVQQGVNNSHSSANGAINDGFHITDDSQGQGGGGKLGPKNDGFIQGERGGGRIGDAPNGLTQEQIDALKEALQKKLIDKGEDKCPGPKPPKPEDGFQPGPKPPKPEDGFQPGPKPPKPEDGFLPGPKPPKPEEGGVKPPNIIKPGEGKPWFKPGDNVPSTPNGEGATNEMPRPSGSQGVPGDGRRNSQGVGGSIQLPEVIILPEKQQHK